MVAPQADEDRAYAELTAAIAEETRILREMDDILQASENREEAEKLILKTHAPLMDAAMKKTREAQDKWIAILKEL